MNNIGPNIDFNITKWSDTLKQFVGKLSTNCLSLFDHFVILKSILGPILFNLCVVDVVDASFLSTVALIRIVLTGIFEVFLTI